MPSSVVLLLVLAGLVLGTRRMLVENQRWWESVYHDQMKAEREFIAANRPRERVYRHRYRYNKYGEIVETTEEVGQ